MAAPPHSFTARSYGTQYVISIFSRRRGLAGEERRRWVAFGVAFGERPRASKRVTLRLVSSVFLPVK